jgi:hypothetical protein
MWRRTWACVTLLAGLLVADSPALASPEWVRKAIQRIDACGAKFQEKPLRTCVADSFDQFASDFTKSPIVSSASGPARQAASGLRAAATREAAVSVVQRAQSAIGNLAAQSSANVRSYYDGINRAFARALSVIKSKG